MVEGLPQVWRCVSESEGDTPRLGPFGFFFSAGRRFFAFKARIIWRCWWFLNPRGDSARLQFALAVFGVCLSTNSSRYRQILAFQGRLIWRFWLLLNLLGDPPRLHFLLAALWALRVGIGKPFSETG